MYKLSWIISCLIVLRVAAQDSKYKSKYFLSWPVAGLCVIKIAMTMSGVFIMHVF